MSSPVPGVSVLLLLSIVFLPGAVSLRTSRIGEPPDGSNEESVVRIYRPQTDADGEGLPKKLEDFTRVWTERYKQERHLLEPLPSSVQLILGVMTTAHQGAYRNVIRQTWLNQKGVCYWTHRPKEGCSVYVAFVIGKTAPPSMQISQSKLEKAQNEEGMLVLDVEENMNDGKSFVWFSTALKTFPWATHVGKMDMDTYPFLHKLLGRMDQNRSCVNQTSPYELIGRPDYFCTGKQHYPETCKFLNPCPSKDCLGQFHSKLDTVQIGAPWRYLLGQFYILSLPLVQQVNWDPQKGNEDVVVSKAVDQAMRHLHSCVALRRLDAFVHEHKPVDAAYANNI